MSHNVRLSHIRFTNLDVLKMAVKELQAEGAKIELVEGQGLKARAVGQVPCDVLLKVEDGRWDVGFVREGDAYVPQLESDFRNPFLSADYNARPVEGCRVDYGHMALGRLNQRYAVIQAELNAAMNGQPTTRTVDPQTQQIMLEVGA